MNRELRRAPWVTLFLVVLAFLADLAPDAGTILEYRRAAVDSGEFWRLLTGQLVHWTPRMAVADLGIVLLAGVWIERRSRRLALLTVVGGLLLVGLGLHFLVPGLSTYRGSSGVASALFVAAALDLAGSSPRSWTRKLALGSLALFSLKLIWEYWTGLAVAAGPLLSGITVIPQAHLLGAVAGILAIGIRHSFLRRRVSVRRINPLPPLLTTTSPKTPWVSGGDSSYV